MKARDVAALAVAVAVSQAAGGIGALFTTPSIRGGWYATLPRPAWTPPSWVFGPVWTALYTAMGVAAWLVWRRRKDADIRLPLTLFGVQLALNTAWSWLFFGRRTPDAAMGEIAVLWIAILATMITFYRVSKPAGWLFVPYLLWVTYASTINGYVALKAD